MVEARWNGQVVARSDDTVVVERNHYFPIDSITDAAQLKSSATTSFCPWKGTAHYYTLVVDGAENADAVWYYPEPKDAAKEIKGRIAFWKGVTVG